MITMQYQYISETYITLYDFSCPVPNVLDYFVHIYHFSTCSYEWLNDLHPHRELWLSRSICLTFPITKYGWEVLGISPWQHRSVSVSRRCIYSLEKTYSLFGLRNAYREKLECSASWCHGDNWFLCANRVRYAVTSVAAVRDFYTGHIPDIKTFMCEKGTKTSIITLSPFTH